MKLTPKGLSLIKKWEAFKPNAYRDPLSKNGLPITIGYGTTRYPDGRSVKMGDTCTEDQAVQWVSDYLEKIDPKIMVQLNDNQIGAIASFIYNLGPTKWLSSTLRRKINANPADPTIAEQFMRWNKSGGKVVRGLTNRRNDEVELYFSSQAG
jgi:lysozyme